MSSADLHVFFLRSITSAHAATMFSPNSQKGPTVVRMTRVFWTTARTSSACRPSQHERKKKRKKKKREGCSHSSLFSSSSSQSFPSLFSSSSSQSFPSFIFSSFFFLHPPHLFHHSSSGGKTLRVSTIRIGRSWHAGLIRASSARTVWKRASGENGRQGRRGAWCCLFDSSAARALTPRHLAITIVPLTCSFDSERPAMALGKKGEPRACQTRRTITN
jgi:hypothetical protein